MVQTKSINNEMDERTKAHFEELKNQYFWEQKRKEIGFLLTIVLGTLIGLTILTILIFMILPIIGMITNTVAPDYACSISKDFSIANPNSELIFPMINGKCGFTGSYVDYMKLGCLGGLAALLWFAIACIALLPLGLCFISWINDNKRLAEKRARKALGIPEPSKKINENGVQIKYY